MNEGISPQALGCRDPEGPAPASAQHPETKSSAFSSVPSSLDLARSERPALFGGASDWNSSGNSFGSRPAASRPDHLRRLSVSLCERISSRFRFVSRPAASRPDHLLLLSLSISFVSRPSAARPDHLRRLSLSDRPTNLHFCISCAFRPSAARPGHQHGLSRSEPPTTFDSATGEGRRRRGRRGPRVPRPLRPASFPASPPPCWRRVGQGEGTQAGRFFLSCARPVC